MKIEILLVKKNDDMKLQYIFSYKNCMIYFIQMVRHHKKKN